MKTSEMVAGAFAGLDKKIEILTKERDEAREWVEKLQRTTQTLTCVYCGHAYPPGTPTHGSDELTAHIKVCTKHPMRALEIKYGNVRQALITLLGDADSIKLLEEMKNQISSLPVETPITISKVKLLGAIDALIESEAGI